MGPHQPQTRLRLRGLTLRTYHRVLSPFTPANQQTDRFAAIELGDQALKGLDGGGLCICQRQNHITLLNARTGGRFCHSINAYTTLELEFFLLRLTEVAHRQAQYLGRQSSCRLFSRCNCFFGRFLGLDLAHRLEAGLVQINQNLVVQANLSYGGVKSSGLGKEASLEAMLEHFTHKKTIMVNMG